MLTFFHWGEMKVKVGENLSYIFKTIKKPLMLQKNIKKIYIDIESICWHKHHNATCKDTTIIFLLFIQYFKKYFKCSPDNLAIYRNIALGVFGAKYKILSNIYV